MKNPEGGSTNAVQNQSNIRFLKWDVNHKWRSRETWVIHGDPVRIYARVSDHTFTLVRVKDRTLEFHVHPDSDEMFVIVSGSMELEFRDRIIKLNEGDMCVAPKGAGHRPICTTEVTCLLVEKGGTLSPENTGGSYKEDS